jgi:pSer/pThr/pTyr-binding forkhead associated (FHA) protein
MIHAPGEPIPPARLVMLTPPAPGAEFALSRDVLRIGRAEDLDAWVNHRSISREHAEIRRSRGSNGQARGAETYTILDLKSANGVRVNGREIHQHQLVPGDVLELGQVRFRFVGEGETYVFEADRTVQMEAIDVAVGQSRAPIYAALAIIGLAVVVALVFAIGPSIRIEDDAPIATALGPEDGHNVRRDSQLEADREHREHIEACEAALAEGRVEAALESVARALTHRPDSAAAIACRSRAEAAEADAQVFENGAAALRAGDFGAAHQAFSMLSTDGIFGDREEVASAREGLVTHHLQAGRAAVRTDPSEARAHAEAVLDLEDVSEAQRAEAREIIAGARRALSAAERPPRERDPNLTPMRPPPTEDDPETPPRPTGTGDGIQACFQQHGSGRPYNQCILQNVRPSNARNLEALILAQRGLENQAAAYRLMRTYVDRFPANPSARAYQQILNVQGQ